MLLQPANKGISFGEVLLDRQVITTPTSTHAVDCRQPIFT
jgi:hypothetical protein